MKKYIFLFLIFQIICINECLSFYNIKNDTTKRKLLVTKIEKTKKAYIIHVQDSVCYVMVSLINKDNKKYKDNIILKEGMEYYFLVTPYFEHNYISPDISFKVVIDGVELYVQMRGENVFTTPNLKGLYYIPPDSMQIKTNP